MFLSQEIVDSIDEANRTHCIGITAIALLLVEKGIFTLEEYERARCKATSHVDQAWEIKKEETKREWVEANSKFLKDWAKFFGEKSDEV